MGFRLFLAVLWSLSVSRLLYIVRRFHFGAEQKAKIQNSELLVAKRIHNSRIWPDSPHGPS